MITTQAEICSFCAQPLGVPDPKHPCPHILYSLTNVIAGVKKDNPPLFGSINNLVFQGGGIKGLAYLGALQQLVKEKEDFLSGIHRIAGTSAGSMVALYLGLNLNLKTEIEPLMNINFIDLLDNSLILKVIVNLDSWKKYLKYKYKNFAVGDIIRAAMKLIKDIEDNLNSSDKKVVEKAEKDVKDLVECVLVYVIVKFKGVGASLLLPDSFVKTATNWLLKMLRPPKHQDAENHLLKSGLTSSECPTKFEDIVNNICDQVSIEALVEAHQDEARHLSMSAEMEQVPYQEDPMEHSEPVNLTAKEESRMKKDASEYLLREKKASVKPDPASDLKGHTLYYSLGEVLWFCLMSQQNAEDIKQKLGLFDGSLLKKKLIEDPIETRVGKLHDSPKDITFQELWDLNSKLPEDKKTKKFYVTSFNVETFRTEVFSVDHTPNVVVADAVRASISIPVFFTPVTIREKTDKGLTPRKIYSSDTVDTTIHYMDGGVLDNYPIWIFDDFKYCVQDIPEFKPRMRYAMQNPRTLGFRLMSSRIIGIYTNPYFDAEKKRMKQINEAKYAETFFYQMGMLLNTEINQTQENEHIKRGDCSRTAYVDNLGMSAIQFLLTEEDKKNLINSGAKSVVNYKARAALNNFVGEGEAYN